MPGGATAGYCATGKRGIDRRPVRTINSATTRAKIGRSIKNEALVFVQKSEVESLPRTCLAEVGGLWRMCGARAQIILIMRYSGAPPKNDQITLIVKDQILNIGHRV